jgi:uncharacterized protein YodC (DUF2158 family)
LVLIASGEQFQDDREPPLHIGDVVQLNSGGPRLLIVDSPDDKTLTISWRDSEGSILEDTLPRGCVHRIDIMD